MSIFKKLFGFGQEAGSADGQGADKAPCVEYQGFTICPTPYMTNGQYQCCGIISKMIDGGICEYRFVRADRFASREDASRMVEIKARRLVDEQGDQLFEN